MPVLSLHFKVIIYWVTLLILLPENIGCDKLIYLKKQEKVFDVTDDVIDFIQNLSLSDIEKIANLKIPILKSRITNSEINEIKRALNNKRERITKQLLLNCLLKQ